MDLLTFCLQKGCGVWPRTDSIPTNYCNVQLLKLEQLECLRSEDTPATPWLPILLIHIGPQVKTRHSQSYIFIDLPKLHIFEFWKKKPFHSIHLLKLLDKMWKYKMYLASVMEHTEQTRFCPQMDRQTSMQSFILFLKLAAMDKMKPIYHPTPPPPTPTPTPTPTPSPLQLPWARGIIVWHTPL